MDRKGLQVAKLGGPALCGVRGYVFYGVRGDFPSLGETGSELCEAGDRSHLLALQVKLQQNHKMENKSHILQTDLYLLWFSQMTS